MTTADRIARNVAERVERARMRADYRAEGVDLSVLHGAMFGDDPEADEHVAEHFDDVYMDCPLCVAEWQAIGGKA